MPVLRSFVTVRGKAPRGKFTVFFRSGKDFRTDEFLGNTTSSIFFLVNVMRWGKKKEAGEGIFSISILNVAIKR